MKSAYQVTPLFREARPSHKIGGGVKSPPTAARDAPAYHPSSHDATLTVCELLFKS